MGFRRYEFLYFNPYAVERDTRKSSSMFFSKLQMMKDVFGKSLVTSKIWIIVVSFNISNPDSVGGKNSKWFENHLWFRYVSSICWVQTCWQHPPSYLQPGNPLACLLFFSSFSYHSYGQNCYDILFAKLVRFNDQSPIEKNFSSLEVKQFLSRFITTDAFSQVFQISNWLNLKFE